MTRGFCLRGKVVTRDSIDTASREISVDLDGKKLFFRKRGWIRQVLERHGARAGDMVTVEEIPPYNYRWALKR